MMKLIFSTVVILSASAATLFTAPIAQASGVSIDHDRDIDLLLRAKSVTDIEKLEDRLNLDQSLDQDCKSELNLRVLPKSCFKALQHRKESASKWLKSECVARAKASKSRIDLREGVDVLPNECREIARERLADLQYLDVSERPSEIWTLERNVN